METAADRFLMDSRRMGNVVLCAVALFALVCTAAQLLRDDLDWLRAPLSFYLAGEYGAWVKFAYFVLGSGMALLGLGYYQALAPAARSGAPLLLFAMAGLALGVTAGADSAARPDAVSLEAWLHGVAARTAFLCLTVAMLLQAARLRADPAWRHRFAPAFALAMACFLAMWVHALWREAPRGLTQKIVIVLILTWLAWAASWLRGPRCHTAPSASALATETVP